MMSKMLISFLQSEERLQEELASFRQEWHDEIQRHTGESSLHGSSRGSPSIESPAQSRRAVQTPSPVDQTSVNKHNHNVSCNKEEKVWQSHQVVVWVWNYV